MSISQSYLNAKNRCLSNISNCESPFWEKKGHFIDLCQTIRSFPNSTPSSQYTPNWDYIWFIPSFPQSSLPLFYKGTELGGWRKKSLLCSDPSISVWPDLVLPLGGVLSLIRTHMSTENRGNRCCKDTCANTSLLLGARLEHVRRQSARGWSCQLLSPCPAPPPCMRKRIFQLKHNPCKPCYSFYIIFKWAFLFVSRSLVWQTEQLISSLIQGCKLKLAGHLTGMGTCRNMVTPLRNAAVSAWPGTQIPKHSLHIIQDTSRSFLDSTDLGNFRRGTKMNA